MQGLKDTLDRLGLKQVELARLLAVSPRTVSLWATGETALPGPVSAYLRVLALAGPAIVAAEVQRLGWRSKMFDEGIYGVTYRGRARNHSCDQDQPGGEALAVLRNGKILGSDRWGGIFSGSYEFDPVAGLNKVHVRIDVPPDGELITGFAAGPKGATFDIVVSLERATPKAAATVSVAGEPVDVEFSFLGPLPN